MIPAQSSVLLRFILIISLLPKVLKNYCFNLLIRIDVNLAFKEKNNKLASSYLFELVIYFNVNIHLSISSKIIQKTETK